VTRSCSTAHQWEEHEFSRSTRLAVPSLKTASNSRDAPRNTRQLRSFSSGPRMLMPDFQMTPTDARFIAEICVRLDGLPLAIELAAGNAANCFPLHRALLSRPGGIGFSVLTVGEQDATFCDSKLCATHSVGAMIYSIRMSSGSSGTCWLSSWGWLPVFSAC